MPSSPKSTLLPVRRATRERLLARKGNGTFDDQIVALLDAAPASLSASRALPPPRPTPRPEPPERRSPQKQLLLRDLARDAWQARVASGEIVEVSSRLIEWRPLTPSGRRVDRVDWPERRGFAP